jgi:hypothetical protein
MAKSVPAGSIGQTSGPDKFKARKFGQLLKRYNALVDLVFAFQPLAGSGLVRNDTNLGRLLSAVAVSGAAGGQSFTYPFQVQDASSDDDGVRVRVRYGVIVDFFSGSSVPDGMSVGDDPPFYLPVSNNDHIILEVDADTDAESEDFGLILSSSIFQSATVPESDFDAGNFYLELANVTVDGGRVTVTPVTGGSFAFMICGGAGTFWSLGPTLA